MMATVFKYTIRYEDSDIYGKQYRYVVANSEEEANEKIEAYRKHLVSVGFADFEIECNPIVEIDNVII